MRFATLLILLAAGLQDPSSRLRELVEKLGEDDIAAADQASADLVKLGPAALAPLREEARKRTGDLKLKIEAVIQKIERADRMSKVLGVPPLVTLHVKDKPVGEAIEELRRQSGVPIEGNGLPADARVSLDLDNAVVWKGIDELCRSHGRLMYAYTPKQVLIESAPYRRLPQACDRGILFLIDGFDEQRYSSRASFQMRAAVVRPPGAKPYLATLLLEEMEDDKGTSLLCPDEQPASFGRKPDGESLILLLDQAGLGSPAEGASSFSKFRGKVVLKFSAEMKSVVTIKNPLDQPTAQEDSGGNRLQLQSWTREGGKLHLQLLLTTVSKSTFADVVVVDAVGHSFSVGFGADYQSYEFFRGRSSGEFNGTVDIPEGVKIASLSWIEPTEIVDISLPFDFKGLPLK